jgi:opacity protein-like surface antigen
VAVTAAGAAAGAMAVAMALPAGSLHGQGISLGVQGSVADEADFGIGPRIMLDLGPFDAGLRVVGSFEIFFPDDLELDDGGMLVPASIDYWEANLNLLYTLGLPLVPITPYVGGGLNFAHLEITGSPNGELDEDGTDTGVNLLAGVELHIASFAPFFEIRRSLGGGDQWVWTGGITFR